jgi:hypothetical protein
VSEGPQKCRLCLRLASNTNLPEVIAAKGLCHWIRPSSERAVAKAYGQGLPQFRRSIAAPSYSKALRKSLKFAEGSSSGPSWTQLRVACCSDP